MRMLSFIMIGKSYPNVQNVQIAALEFLEVFYQLCQLVASTKSKKVPAVCQSNFEFCA